MSSADGASLPTAFLVLFWPAFCLVLLCMCLATMRGAADAKLELLMTQMLMTQDKLELQMTKMLDAFSNHKLEALITRHIESMDKLGPIESTSRHVGCQTKLKVPKICSGIDQPQFIGRIASSSGESSVCVSSAESLRSQPPVWTCSMPQLSDAFDLQHAGAANKGTGLHTSSLRTGERRPDRHRLVSVDQDRAMLLSG